MGDAAIAAFTTVVMASVGKSFAANGFKAGEAFAFGYIGGVTSMLRGGKFGHGFVSAYVGAVTGGHVQGIENPAGDQLAFGGKILIRVLQ